MNQRVKGRASPSDTLRRGLNASPARLWGGYTLLFALFFTVVFSPFLLYGRTFLMLLDGNAQHVSSLTYFRHWVKTIVEGLAQGKPEVPFWSLWIGFGESTLTNGICFRPLYLLSLLFRPDVLDRFLVLRLVLRLYGAGLAFLAYGRTRVKRAPDLLLGCMIYLFSGFVLYYGPRYSYFVSMMIELPLLLLGVDRIFEKGWSWLFILTVAVEALCGFYMVVLITIPAVVYAAFHFFELSPKARRRCGGFWRILGRHAVQYALGLCLAAAGLLPTVFKYLESSRNAADSGQSLLHWDIHTYMDYVRGIVDGRQIAYEGFIALPGIALVGALWLLRARKRQDRLLRGQMLLYHLVCLVPLLTMIFSGMAGRRLRWCYILSFWTALGAACALPGLREDDGRGLRFCLAGMGVYALAYLAAAVWTGDGVSLALVLALLGAGVLCAAMMTPRGRSHPRLITALLFAWLLIELTAKSYELNSPQYENTISAYADAGQALAITRDNAADALEMAGDDGLFRTDVITVPYDQRARQVNYGQRNLVNGVSSYYSLFYGAICDTSLGLGNAHQTSNHTLMDLDQRTVLDALAGVKYVAALEEGLARVPYGYEQVDAREKRLSDGTVTTEYLFKNRYPLPLSYAYEARVSRETYDALPPNRKEQAMLQGVLLEEDVPLPEAALRFDDEVLLDNDAIVAALAAQAAVDEDLDFQDGVLSVRKKNYTFEMPLEKTEGEICLQFTGLGCQSFNFGPELADALARAGATRLEVMNARRSSRQWTPSAGTTITAASGKLSDECMLRGPEHYLYMGKRDMLLNLGCGQSGQRLKLRFGAPGKYSFDSVVLIRQPMDGYAEKLRPLQANGASAVAVDGNRVTVEYDLDRPAFACLAIPYSPDWRAKVDGRPAPLLRANGMYMGVMLDSGRHTIEFTCVMRGFWPGVAISLATLVALALIALLRRARRGRRVART